MNLSILKYKQFIKEKQNDILLFIFVFLIAVISFGLGLLITPKLKQKTIKIESCTPNVSQKLDQLLN